MRKITAAAITLGSVALLAGFAYAQMGWGGHGPGAYHGYMMEPGYHMNYAGATGPSEFEGEAAAEAPGPRAQRGPYAPGYCWR